MSYSHPYRNPPDDFSTGTEKDSQRIYSRDSSAYRSRVRSISSEHTSPSSSDPTVFPPVKALSFLHSCGLDAEDLQTLAKLPEHLITTDTLPDLLAQIKKKKASSTSSSRSSAVPISSSARTWEDRSHTQQMVAYPSDLPVHQSYSVDREQSQTWDNSWGNDQQTTSSSSNYVVEYNHLKEKKLYYDKQSYDTELSMQKSSAAPQSYSNYSRDVSQSSHLSSRDSQSSYLSSRDNQSSYLSAKDSQSSYLSSRDSQSYVASRDTQSSYLSSRDGQSSYLSSRDGQSSHRSSRDVSQSSQLSSRDVSQSSQLSSRYASQSSQRSSRDSGLQSPLSGRGIGSFSSSSSRDVALPSLLSMRDLAPTSHLSGRGTGQSSQSSQHWATPAGHRVPTRKEASDFHGRTPPVFPYACVLCEITVLSNKDWSVHITGPQHANSQLSLVEKYPQWDQTIQSARRNEPQPGRSKSRTAQERGGTSSSRKGSSGSKSVTSTSKPVKSESTSKCKVVCVKFEVDGVNEAYLKQLLGQFGAIVKMIMFPRLALVEMGTPGQAEDVVKYFIHNPLKFKGVLLEFTLSAAFSFLQSSRVVSFSPVPSGDGVRSELLALAKRFGSVKQSLFLLNRGYVEMADVEESSKLVEHYSTNSLKLKGKSITVSFSSEYQTLSDIDDGGKDKSPVPHRRRRSLSPKRRSHSSRRDSPSPKRRSYDSRKRDERRHSSEKSRQESSSRSRSKKVSPSKDEKSKTNKKENVEETAEEDKDQSDNTGDDSDLEGVAVIADDGEELNSEDEFTVDEDMDYEILDTSDALIEQDTSEDVQVENESSDQIIPSDMDASNVEAETSECAPTVTNGSSEEENKKAQEIQGEQKELQQEEKEIQDEEKELRQEEKEIQDEEKELQQGEQKELQQEDKEIQDKEKELQQEEQKELQQGEQKEPKQGEQKEPEQEEKNIVKEDKDLQQGEKKEDKKGEQELKPEEKMDLTEEQNKLQGEPKDKPVAMEEEAASFPENLENVLTDEFEENVNTEKGDEKEDSASKIEEVFGRVLEVMGFPVAKKYSEADLLKIGQKYGDVADCCLVRANRKVEKALIEMVNAADAAKVETESKKQHIKLGGKILRITVSQKYSQVNEGKSVGSDTKQQQEENKKEPSCSVVSGEESAVVMSNAEMENDMDTIMQTSGVDEEAYGRVLRIRNLPLPEQYTDADFLSIAEPYGTVKRHWMLRLHQTGLIEMENASDAEKVVAAAQMNKITIAGKHPKIIVSTKHAHLNKRYFLYGSSDEQTSIESEMAKDESNTPSSVSEQPSLQTLENVKESSNDNPDGSSVGDEKQVSVANDEAEMEAENSDPVPEIETPKLDPAGTEFVRPVVGYFCNLCNVIYASEEEAKNEHCSTPSHHQKLKEHKERNGSA